MRFQRALYRFWLYCFLAEIDWQHDEPVDTHWAERFLQEFSTQELLEMIRVSRFVKEVVDWTDCAANSPGCSCKSLPLRQDVSLSGFKLGTTKSS